VLTRGDVRFKLGGKYVSDWSQADEVQITIKASKTDQYREGARRSLTVSGEPICIVEALKKLFSATPTLSDSAPLFVNPRQGMLTRAFISEVLKSAARDLGHTTTGLSSHSLRGGGATALWNAGRTTEEICYLGRWKSDSWKIYTKMTAQRLEGVSHELASASYTLASDKEEASSRQSRIVQSGPNWGHRWYDDEDGQEYVILNTYFSTYHRVQVSQYVSRNIWDLLDKSKGGEDIESLCEQVLLLSGEVYVSSKLEVEAWTKATNLEPLA